MRTYNNYCLWSSLFMPVDRKLGSFSPCKARRIQIPIGWPCDRGFRRFSPSLLFFDVRDFPPLVWIRRVDFGAMMIWLSRRCFEKWRSASGRQMAGDDFSTWWFRRQNFRRRRGGANSGTKIWLQPSYQLRQGSYPINTSLHPLLIKAKEAAFKGIQRFVNH